MAERRGPGGTARGRGPRRDPVRARRERLEMLAGFLGFFTAISFVFAVIAEVQGKSAYWEALVLAVFAVSLGLTVRALRRS